MPRRGRAIGAGVGPASTEGGNTGNERHLPIRLLGSVSRLSNGGQLQCLRHWKVDAIGFGLSRRCYCPDLSPWNKGPLAGSGLQGCRRRRSGIGRSPSERGGGPQSNVETSVDAAQTISQGRKTAGRRPSNFSPPTLLKPALGAGDLHFDWVTKTGPPAVDGHSARKVGRAGARLGHGNDCGLAGTAHCTSHAPECTRRREGVFPEP